MENKKKKHPILIGLLCLLVTIGGIYGWATQIEPTHFQLKKTTYIHENIPEGFDGFKIALISDFDLQTTEDLDYLEKCVQTINNANCDMVIFCGDLYESSEIFSEERLISILKQLDVTKGKLAVLGENEIKANTDTCISILEKGGFEVMRNDAHFIYSNNDRIVFAGLENNGNVDALLNEEMANAFVLTAVHQPDYFTEVQTSSSNLQLSGHSGGGFIQLPFIGGLISLEGSTTYISGTTNIDGHTLYITNGIGLGHTQTARFNCSPNALIITLRTSN